MFIIYGDLRVDFAGDFQLIPEVINVIQNHGGPITQGPGCNRIYGYVMLAFISTCASYIFNILLDIFPLYLLVTTRL